MRDSLFLKTSLAAAIVTILFLSTFKLLQDSNSYNSTVGFFLRNYERTGSWDAPIISKTDQGYTTNLDFNNWDAAIYNCIQEHSYHQGFNCYDQARPVFLPFFPYIWKVLHLSFLGISLLNFLFFILAIFIAQKLSKSGFSFKELLLVFSLPGFVFIAMPYTESLFILLGILSAYLYLNKAPKLSLICLVFLAMLRPASWILIVALILVALIYRMKASLRISTLLLASLLLAILLSFALQFLGGAEWGAFFKASRLWSSGWSFPQSFSDWSEEGYGMNIFSLVFVTIPAAYYLTQRLIKNRLIKDQKDFLILSCLSYFIGVTLYQFFTSAGSMHSYYRFILGSPAFFTLLFLLKTKLSALKNLPLWLFGAAFLLVISQYIGGSLKIEHLGFILLLGNAIFLLKSKIGIGASMLANSSYILLLILNVVWGTYLYNMYLTNAWIFL